MLKLTHLKKKRIDAFSLAEILIVLAIMGILIMLVVPNNAGVAARTKSLEAQQELKMVQSRSLSLHPQGSKHAQKPFWILMGMVK